MRLAQIVLKQVSGKDERSKNALIVAASSIAAVRTAREQKIVPESWAVTHGVDDSVRLAEMVLKRIQREE